MAKKKAHKACWQNIKLNLVKRLEAAKRKWKSANYIHDLEIAVSKRH